MEGEPKKENHEEEGVCPNDVRQQNALTGNSAQDLTQLIHDLRGSICTMIAAMRAIDLQTRQQPDVQEMVAVAMRGFDQSNIFVDQLRNFAEKLIEQNELLAGPQNVERARTLKQSIA